MNERKSGIDVFKLFFACLIPVLHIAQAKNIVAFAMIGQYIARLGVPFFFVTSGMFLRNSIEKRGRTKAFCRYIHRVGRMLVIWLLIYSPLYMIDMRENDHVLRSFFFLTPGYLWYLSAVLFATILLYMVRNVRALWLCGLMLHLCGTLMGESYSWLTGGWPMYEEFFLTTRNGLFFALPHMLIGMTLDFSIQKKTRIFGTIGSILLLYIEITLIGSNAPANADRSMYIMLPIATYFIVSWAVDLKITLNTQRFQVLSSAIYLMQYGIIAVVGKGMRILSVSVLLSCLVIWCATLFIPFAACCLLSETRLAKYLF